MSTHVIRKGVAADFPGPLCKTDYAPGEVDAYDAVREHLDSALQVAHIAPYQPAMGADPLQYQAGLLGALAQHTESYTTWDADSMDARVFNKYRDRILGEVMQEPHRLGTLAEVKTVDRAGREIREFVGNMKSWTSQFEGQVMVSPIYLDGQPQRA
jgi:hypothetical protein